jgi:hypothetical protein
MWSTFHLRPTTHLLVKKTDAFFGLHVSEILNKYKRLAIGRIVDEKPQWIVPTPGALSVVPMAEPIWLSKGLKSPYFDESHRALQRFMRKFVDEHIIPEARAHEKTDERPSDELFHKLSEAKITHMRLGPGPWLHGLTLADGALKGEDYTYLHELVVNQEIARMGARGFADVSRSASSTDWADLASLHRACREVLSFRFSNGSWFDFRQDLLSALLQSSILAPRSSGNSSSLTSWPATSTSAWPSVNLMLVPTSPD